jgi:hypothetical protein
MAALVLDTGALIALERADRGVADLIYRAAEKGVDVLTSSICVAEAWRDPRRQARFTRALVGCREAPLDAAGARRAGVLLALSHTDDVANAAVALLAQNGDTVLTGDPDDIAHLLSITRTNARVRRV